MLDTVHTLNKYYDGPELGTADFESHPHVYERISERHDGRPEVYRLSPISMADFSAVKEDWQIRLRWKAAQDERSLSEPDDGPRVLPSDLNRFLELEPLVETALQIDEARAVKVTGEVFERTTKVEWQRV